MTEDQKQVTSVVAGETEICAPPSESCDLSGDYLNLKDFEFSDFSASELANRYGKIVQLAGNLLEADSRPLTPARSAQAPAGLCATSRIHSTPFFSMRSSRPGHRVCRIPSAIPARH